MRCATRSDVDISAPRVANLPQVTGEAARRVGAVTMSARHLLRRVASAVAAASSAPAPTRGALLAEPRAMFATLTAPRLGSSSAVRPRSGGDLFGAIGAHGALLAPPSAVAALLARTQRHIRGVASSIASLQAKKRGKPQQDDPTAGNELANAGGSFDEITDKWIPEKPVSAVEAGGYGIVIAAALAVALGAVWFSFKELIFEPKEQTVFNRALDKIAVDPRVTVRVGTPMTGYGREGRSRSARQHVPHATHVDGMGREHVRIQGAVRGPQGKATVHADAYKGESGEWEFAYLLVDTARERIAVVEPRAAPSIMRTDHSG